MSKQNYNRGLESEGPHRQGEKGGKGGMEKKAGMSAGGGPGKTKKEAIGPIERGSEKRPRTPMVSGKRSPEGKGSGNR